MSSTKTRTHINVMGGGDLLICGSKPQEYDFLSTRRQPAFVASTALPLHKPEASLTVQQGKIGATLKAKITLEALILRSCLGWRAPACIGSGSRRTTTTWR
jgi:hypothetical protein